MSVTDSKTQGFRLGLNHTDQNPKREASSTNWIMGLFMQNHASSYLGIASQTDTTREGHRMTFHDLLFNGSRDMITYLLFRSRGQHLVGK